MNAAPLRVCSNVALLFACAHLAAHSRVGRRLATTKHAACVVKYFKRDSQSPSAALRCLIFSSISSCVLSVAAAKSSRRWLLSSRLRSPHTFCITCFTRRSRRNTASASHCATQPHETRHVRSSSRGSCSEGHSHGWTPVHGERAPRVHPPHCPALWQSGSNLNPRGGRTVQVNSITQNSLTTN